MSRAAAKKTARVAAVEGEARFVRLTGIAARVDGKTLPIGKSLRVGVEIPEALAEARLAEGSAERVSASAITAEALREAAKALLVETRKSLESFGAAIDASSDGDLAELATGGLEALSDHERLGALTAAFDDAVRAHRAAVETEAEPQAGEPSGGGTEPA